VITYLSRKPIIPIFEDRAAQIECFTREDGTDSLSRKAGNQSPVPNIPGK